MKETFKDIALVACIAAATVLMANTPKGKATNLGNQNTFLAVSTSTGKVIAGSPNATLAISEKGVTVTKSGSKILITGVGDAQFKKYTANPRQPLSHNQPAGTITTTTQNLVKGNGSVIVPAIPGTDYLQPSGDGRNLTGITAGQVGAVDNVAFRQYTGGQNRRVKSNDPKMTDARVPLPHMQHVSTITGLAPVAVTGSYSDLSDKPTGWLPLGTTTASIPDSSNKRYVTDAQKAVINNTSGTNSGDETTTTITSKIGNSYVKGSRFSEYSTNRRKTEHTHNNKSYLDAVSSAILTESGIVDNLISTSSLLPLSAKQGKALQDAKKDSGAFNQYSTAIALQLVAKQNALGNYSSASGQAITKYKNGRFYSSPVAGVATAADIAYASGTVQQALDGLLYVHPTVSLSGGSIYETGSTVSIVVLNWTTNKPITTQSLNNGIGTVSPSSVRTYTHSGQSITSDRTYTITVGDGTNTATGSTTVSFSNKRYWGVSANSTLNDAQIIALSSEFSGSKIKSFTLSPSAQYMYYIFPDYLGAASVTVNGFPDTSWVLVQRAFVNSSGYSATYRIYRSANILTGTYNVGVQ